jgi:uncharacterized lipoprotein YajG
VGTSVVRRAPSVKEWFGLYSGVRPGASAGRRAGALEACLKRLMYPDASLTKEIDLLKHIVFAIAICSLTACGTTSVGLKYTADSPVAQASPTAPPLTVGTFVDQRGKPGNYLGAIRGGFGNPLKTLESDRPVGELVKAAFSDGLRARGAVVESASSQNQISGTIRRLDCNQYVRREAHVEIEIMVVDKAGQQRFTRTYSAANVDGSVLALDTGVLASVDDLRVVLEKTLRDTVDKALDDSALRAALQL